MGSHGKTDWALKITALHIHLIVHLRGTCSLFAIVETFLVYPYYDPREHRNQETYPRQF